MSLLPTAVLSRIRVLPLLLMATGCSTLPDGRLWGADATFVPGWQRVRDSASEAARDPWVWIPLLGAAVFQIDDWDRRTADWARGQTPVFGSVENAEDWSDGLRDASAVAHYATLVATPGGAETGDWFASKARGTLVSMAAVSSTVLVTRTLKTGMDRERPNGQGGESFPSGHTSSSAVHTRLASRNLRSISIGRGLRCTLDTGLAALTLGTSWSRIEAGWHYPSDTLVGMALGNFFAAFVYDAFMGLEGPPASLALMPVEEGAVLQWRLKLR